MINSKDLAKWFIKNGCGEFHNDLNSNMRLQKLLYFSQLVHLAKHDELLFNEPMNAFKNGTVIENIRLEYKDNYSEFIAEARWQDTSFNEKVEQVLKAVCDIFEDATAEELSDLNHEHTAWSRALERSRVNGTYIKSKSVIDIGEVIEFDLDGVREMLDAYEEDDNSECIIINGVKYYYDPNEIEMTEDIKKKLLIFPAQESAYSVGIDCSAGLVIY